MSDERKELEQRRRDQKRYLDQNTPYTRNLAAVNARYILDLEERLDRSER